MTAPLQATELTFDVQGGTRLARSPATDQLRTYLGSLIADGFPPSVSLAVVEPDGIALEAFGGHACVTGDIVTTTRHTAYDLASLTKVVCTVTLVMRASQRGALDLDDPVTRWLPRYPEARTTLRHLLTHTAGLVDHRPFYMTLRGRQPIEEAVLSEAAGTVPGVAVRYSDLGYMLLGWVLEACYGRPLDETFAAEVTTPLGLQRTRFRPPATERSQIAATELDGDQRVTPGLVWGEVHDGNAYALGGVSGHAGLFAPLGELARFVHELLCPAPDNVMSAGSLAAVATRQATTDDDFRGIGWRLRPSDWGHWPEGTIWHTGFTGTSLVVSPAAGAAVVLLTNSVHPRRHLERQSAMRADVHRLVAEALQ